MSINVVETFFELDKLSAGIHGWLQLPAETSLARRVLTAI
jgi:hypothetical protein